MSESRSVAAGAASLAAGLMVGGPLMAAGVGGKDHPSSATDTTATTTTASDPPTVPRAEYDRAVAKSAKRLRGWRRAERQRERLKRVARVRFGYVVSGLLCIHGGEGSWSAATGNGYFGGLQMDLRFQRTYGLALLERFGTANRWPAEAQVAVGTVAYYAGRGFGPWPNTRKGCGL